MSLMELFSNYTPKAPPIETEIQKGNSGNSEVTATVTALGRAMTSGNRDNSGNTIDEAKSKSECFDETISHCRSDAETLAYFLGRAADVQESQIPTPPHYLPKLYAFPELQCSWRRFRQLQGVYPPIRAVLVERNSSSMRQIHLTWTGYY